MNQLQLLLDCDNFYAAFVRNQCQPVSVLTPGDAPDGAFSLGASLVAVEHGSAREVVEFHGGGCRSDRHFLG